MLLHFLTDAFTDVVSLVSVPMQPKASTSTSSTRLIGKRQSYSPPLYLARCLLAAVDFNSHANREPQKGADRNISAYNATMQRHTSILPH
ncbi:hypothetical protein SNE40_018209 [Patella caerulea]|uniref:Uncharacterized protein n=1 Tax=Patella caerulea TaxID=87958 RepID=A0AAN8P6S5_PATCE